MSNEFTKYSNDSIWEMAEGDTDPQNALSYLNNPENFRPFHIGLTQLLQKCGYTGPDQTDEKTDYLHTRLSSIGVSVTKSTIEGWFSAKRRPALVSNSRTLMYQVCFALCADMDTVRWFFSHVYFDRIFNCHTIPEAVYYYCFKNRLPYSKAVEYLKQIKDFPEAAASDSAGNVLTKEIRMRLDSCTTENQFLDFFRNNKSLFSQWNQTSQTYISKFLTSIRGKNSDKALIEQHKKGISPLPGDLDSCGLIIQEYFYNFKQHKTNYPVSGKNIASIDFMLDWILTINTGLAKNVHIPDSIKTNFPSKKIFSDLLNKSDTSTSYDSIRKCLILLKFYQFWCLQLLHPSHLGIDIFDIYVEETDAILIDCGYEELFSGNPYDWLFLWASTNASPLSALRSAIQCMPFDE